MRSRRDCAADLAERLALGWVERYTAGVDAESRTTRRAEVASDLHEHRAACTVRGVSANRIGLSVLGRLLRGAPVDLVLRWQRLAARAHPMDTASPDRSTRRRRSTPMSTRNPADPQPWRPLPEAHRFNQLNDVVDVTSDQVGTDAGEDDRVVARNAANIAAGISAGGLQ